VAAPKTVNFNAVGPSSPSEPTSNPVLDALRPLFLEFVGVPFDTFSELVRAATLGAGRSPATQKSYREQYQRMRKNGWTPSRYKCRRSFYFARAAFIAGLADDLRQGVRDLVVACATKDHAKRDALLDKIRTLYEELQQFPPDPDRQNVGLAMAGLLVGEYRRLHEDASKSTRRSKRVGLHHLPKNWEERVIQEAEAAGSTFSLGIAILAATGCRPSELAFGVYLACGDDGESVAIRIWGKKFKPGWSGQQWREVVLHRESVGARRLVDLVHSGVGPVIIKAANTSSLEDAVRTFGTRVYDGRSYSISAYSFRHQLSSDVEAMGRGADLPALLGHAVDRTCQAYGDQRYGRGRRRFRVQISGTVKGTAKDPRSLKGRVGPGPSND